MSIADKASTATRHGSSDFGLTSFGVSKIQDHHHQRLAVIYVRQSTPRQVLEHQESTRLQYQLAERAEQFGWRKDRVLIIDEDLGITGRYAEPRTGFQRLLAEVGLNHVGLVLGTEMSRLARSNKDWHQLLELCAIFRCLLADQDGLYDPVDYNDRLLLGLKGAMSEAELHILKSRMLNGSRNKASRGELVTHLPVGYIRLPTDEVVLDPDEQVQATIRLAFEKFDELGTAMLLLRYLRDQDIHLPFRVKSGLNKGQTEWRPARYSTVNYILKNPTYAGTYTYGRYQQDPRRTVIGAPNSGRFLAPIEDWKIILHDKFPAYISWDQYVANRERLEENRAKFDTPGVPRDGNALLAGILVCGRCGRRLQPHYKERPEGTAYFCQGEFPHVPDSQCQRLIAKAVDELVYKLVLDVVQPASLKICLESAERIREERRRLHEHWEQRIQRAAYATTLAQRQYDSIDPENRLVARELERRWEQALVEQRQLEEDFDRFKRDHPKELSESELNQIECLSAALPDLWNSASTSNADRQTIVRHLVDHVEIEVQGNSELVDVAIHWAGGYVSQHEVIRSVASYEQLHRFDEMKSFIEDLWQTGHATPAIATRLNSKGFRTPKRQGKFTRHMVRKLLDKWGLTQVMRPQISAEMAKLEPNEWWLIDLSRELHVDKSTLARWCRKDWCHARKLAGRCKWWVVWADREERERLKRLYECSRGRGKNMYSYQELRTPKPRPTQ